MTIACGFISVSDLFTPYHVVMRISLKEPVYVPKKVYMRHDSHAKNPLLTKGSIIPD